MRGKIKCYSCVYLCTGLCAWAWLFMALIFLALQFLAIGILPYKTSNFSNSNAHMLTCSHAHMLTCQLTEHFRVLEMFRKLGTRKLQAGGRTLLVPVAVIVVSHLIRLSWVDEGKGVSLPCSTGWLSHTCWLAVGRWLLPDCLLQVATVQIHKYTTPSVADICLELSDGTRVQILGCRLEPLERLFTLRCLCSLNIMN